VRRSRFPGLARYDEVAHGAIHHALRFTVDQTQRGYIHPATHFASSRWNDEDLDQLKTVPGSAFEAVTTGPILRSSG
jgi:hypothetical protein